MSPEDLSAMSSSLYGSAASCSEASAGDSNTKRSNFWPDLMIFFMRFSMRLRSSGVNGSATSKS